MSDLYLVFKNLCRKKLRLFLNSFAIFIAFLIFGTVSALKGALDSGVTMSADNRLVVIHRTNFTVSLPYSHFTKVKAVEGVKDVTHASWFGGYFREPRQQVVALAVDPDSYFNVYDELSLSEETLLKWKRNRTGMLVGERLARTYGWKVGDRVPISSSIFTQTSGGHTWDLAVDGIFGANDQKTDTGYLVFHHNYFMETQSFGGERLGWLVLTSESPEINEQVASAIDEEFANSADETETTTEKAFNKAFLEQIGNIGLIIFSVVLVAFFTILVVVGNSMVLAIRERTQEIAVLKTLGFTSGRIFRMVLAESLLLSFLGGLPGIAMASLLVKGFSEQMARFLPNMVLSDGIVLQALLYMLALGLVTGILPALNALRLNIVTAFSQEA